MDNDKREIEPVAYIATDFKEKFGLPRQSGRIPELTGKIIFTEKYGNPDYVKGIEDFSHVWLIFGFSSALRDEYSPTVRPPKLGGNTRKGVFATRAPFRPNGLGLSCVKLEKISTENNRTVLFVSGIDILDGTPIYDVKPYIPYSDSIPSATGGFADEHKDEKLTVIFSDSAVGLLPDNVSVTVAKCIADDPRPSYQNDPERIYKMRYKNFDIHFKVADGTAIITNVFPIDN